MKLMQQQIIELIRCGLWNFTSDSQLFKDNVDWNRIVDLARQHG